MKEGHLKIHRRKRLQELKQNSRETGVTFDSKTDDVIKDGLSMRKRPEQGKSPRTRDSMKLPPIQPQPTFTPSNIGDGDL